VLYLNVGRRSHALNQIPGFDSFLSPPSGPWNIRKFAELAHTKQKKDGHVPHPRFVEQLIVTPKSTTSRKGTKPE
jgi:hypothetical protein